MVVSEARRLGVGLGAEEAGRIGSFLELVERWGHRLNLTGCPDRAALVSRQLADALVLAERCRSLSLGPASALDVGAGAGLVGLPLALLCPELSLGLLEASRRKCAFLRTAAHGLGLAVRVHEGRLEKLALPPQALVLSRATWAPARWAELGVRLLAPGGLLCCFLAREPAPEHPDLGLLELRSYQLADGSPRGLALLRRR